MKSYNEILSQHLNSSPLLRHLFSRIGTEVTIQIEGRKIRGIFKSIDILLKTIEVSTKDAVYYLPIRNIKWMKTVKILDDSAGTN